MKENTMPPKNNTFFDKIFDLNGDGKLDLSEEYLAYRIFENVTKAAEEDPDDDRDEDEDDDIETV